MALKFRCTAKATLRNRREPYAFFDGPYTEAMPNLIADNRIPISVAQVMKNRVGGIWSSADVEFWRNDYWHSGDGFIRNADGSGAIVLDAEYIREINPQTRLTPERSVALDRKILSQERDCYHLSAVRIAQIGDEGFYADEAKDSPEWQFLAREQENPGLLGSYVDMLFRAGKERYGYMKPHGFIKAMKLSFRNPEKETSGRSCVLSDLGNRLYAFGCNGINGEWDEYTRLVGVDPNALSQLENRVISRG